KRQPIVQATSSVQSQRYLRLVPNKDGQLVDDRELAAQASRRKAEGGVEGGVVGGVVGGVAGGSMGWMDLNAPKPPPPAAPIPQMAKRRSNVSESISVTAAAPVVAMDAMQDKKAESQGIDVVVRSDFRSTALWQPDVITGSDGTARVTLTYPEALTTWRATARSATT